MIQTNYVPLEHPYRVVYYKRVIGLQVGTLIVTTEAQDRSGSRVIETASRPVVSYCSIEAKKAIDGISYPGVYSEAVVWDKVEQNDVTTLAIEGGSVDWDDFFCEIIPDFWGEFMLNSRDNNVYVFSRFLSGMERLGIKIKAPEIEGQEYKLDVTLCTYDDAGTMFCGTVDGSPIRIDCSLDKNEDEVFNDIFRQAGFYRTCALHMFVYAGVQKFMTINFIPAENTAFLQRLCERMNKEQEGTCTHIPTND